MRAHVIDTYAVCSPAEQEYGNEERAESDWAIIECSVTSINKYCCYLLEKNPSTTECGASGVAGQLARGGTMLAWPPLVHKAEVQYNWTRFQVRRNEEEEEAGRARSIEADFTFYFPMG